MPEPLCKQPPTKRELIVMALVCVIVVSLSLCCMAAAPRHGTDGPQRLNGTQPTWTEFDLTGGRAALIVAWGNLTSGNLTMQFLANQDDDDKLWLDVWNATCVNGGENCTVVDNYTPAVFGRFRLGFKSAADYNNVTDTGNDTWFFGKVKQ